MPDHLHAFVATLDEVSEEFDLEEFAEKKMVVPHCQKTFFDHVLRSNESYSEKWNYVRENPVRAGLVKTAAKWPFMGEIFRLEYCSD